MSSTLRRAATTCAVSLALVFAGTGLQASAEEEPPAEPPATTPPVTVPDAPEPPAPEVGVVDGVEVAVGLPPVPPVGGSTEVGVVDGVEVAVGEAPVPTTVVQPVVTPSRPAIRDTPTVAAPRPAAQGVHAVTAATQLIDSMETINALLDAWS